MRSCIIMLIVLFNIVCAQIKEVNMKILFTWNNSNEAKKEYMFTNPQMAKTDKDNNIYIVDKNSSRINIYDSRGVYKRTIGNAGDGPGEFKTINNMVIDLENNIIITDEINSRITYLDLNGRYIKSNIINQEIRNLKMLECYDNKTFIGFKSGYSDKGSSENKIVMYDKYFENIITSFAHSSIFWKHENPFEIMMDKYSMLKYAIMDKKIYLVKKYYDGNLYLFFKTDKWGTKILNGIETKTPYKLYDKKLTSYEIKNASDYMIRFSRTWKGQSKDYTVACMAKSIGVINYKNKYIVNFVVEGRYINKCKMYAYIYDDEGICLGKNVVNKNSGVDLEDEILAVDNDSNIIVKEYVDGIPIIRKYEINIERRPGG